MPFSRGTVSALPCGVDPQPEGYVSPFLVYLVEYTDDSGDACLGQLGGFTSEAEAEKLLSRLTGEGRRNVRLNQVAIHARWTDYEYDR